MASETTTDEPQALRRRVQELERQLAETSARANLAIADAQDRAYWLDRWHLDLNALMRWRGAAELRAAFRVARSVYRLLYVLSSRGRRLPAKARAARRGLEEERTSSAFAAAPVMDAFERVGEPPRPGERWLNLGVAAHTAEGVQDVEWARLDRAPERPPLPYDDERFDAAVVSSTWCTHDADQWLTELHRVVKPRGRVALVAAAPAERVLTLLTPRWRVALFVPREAGQDVYVLERR